MIPLSVLVCSALFAFAAATNVQQCPGHSAEGLRDNVQLKSCNRIPCRLSKGKNQHIVIKFTPEKDISDLKNHVTADVLGVVLPFVGVDGNSVCDKLETESGEKTSCPLKANTVYVYKDSFPVLDFYPSIDVKVHWALQNKNEDVICFEVAAKIV